MPKYRYLNLKAFITAIDPLLVEEYFLSRVPQDQLIPCFRTMGMNFQYVKDLMVGLRDEKLKGKIGEELRQICDLSGATDILVMVTSANNIPMGKDETPQQLAMALLLKHTSVFEHAWTLYCYRRSTTQVHEYCLPSKTTNMESINIPAFTNQIRDFFVKQAKGDHCLVKEFEAQDETALMIIHGSYIKTVARWLADEVVIDTYRPAYEDVILYDKTKSVLKIKASRKDRQQYYKSFAECILNISDPIQSEQNSVYTLRPLEDKTFKWDGNERISSIVVLEAHLKLPGTTEPAVIVRSTDVRRTFEEDLAGLNFSSGQVVYVKFRFTLETDGGPETAVFVINPPAVSDLTKISHRDIIAEYLQKNGVLRV